MKDHKVALSKAETLKKKIVPIDAIAPDHASFSMLHGLGDCSFLLKLEIIFLLY